MSDGADGHNADEHLDYEAELASQLAEQKEALEGIDAALEAEPSEELQEMKSALEAAITELQAALLEFKRAKLLAAVSAAFDRERQHSAGESMPSTSGRTHSSFSVGDACRFLGDDGRWYEGRVAALHQDGHAGVEYRVPTRLYMLEAALRPLQRLRAARMSTLFGRHIVEGATAFARPGVLTAAASAAAAAAATAASTAAAMAAAAATSSPPPAETCGSGIWEEVHVIAVDVHAGAAAVRQGQRRFLLPVGDLLRQAWLDDSDLDDCSGDDESGAANGPSGEAVDAANGVGGADPGEAGDEYWEDGDDDDNDTAVTEDNEDAAAAEAEAEDAANEEAHGGLGLDVLGHARLAAAAGAMTDSAHFADWEAHSRGVASRLLARMGYVRGTGLGRDGRVGSAVPLTVTLLPARRGLGGAPDAAATAVGTAAGRKRKRGGERSRRRKHADLSRSTKQAAADGEAAAERKGGPGAAGLFSFINKQLGDDSEAASKIKDMERSLLKGVAPPPGGGRFGQPVTKGASARVKADSRAALMRQQDRVAACEAKVAHFQAMLERNTGNAGLSRQVAATLAQAGQELLAAKQEAARMRSSIAGKEAQSKFWTKF